MPTQPAENRINKRKLVGQIQSHTTLDTHLLHTEACLSSSFGTQGVPCTSSESFCSMQSLPWDLEKRIIPSRQRAKLISGLALKSKLSYQIRSVLMYFK